MQVLGFLVEGSNQWVMSFPAYFMSGSHRGSIKRINILELNEVRTVKVELNQSSDIEYLVKDNYPAIVGFVMLLHISFGIISF